ncbi:MAG: hypothetical protein LBE09_07015 [Christensenellaceae bacterium]|jgi:hypothetical protein|nr:hypothetical protein [Christensenellaceae bacterium]
MTGQRGGARPGAGRKKRITYTDLSNVNLDAPISPSNGHSSFTQEQMEILSQSPHVVSVTKKTVSYMLIFKELFWRRYKQGAMPDKIFRDFGIDPQIVGMNRIWGLVAKGLQFTNGRERQPGKGNVSPKPNAVIQEVTAADMPDLDLNVPKPPRSTKSPRVVVATVSRDDLQRLFHQVAYLTQEMEFLKKIILAGKNER